MCDVQEWLVKENTRLRKAGCRLAEAALYVAREYDGVHRLMIEVSEWSKAIADEGGRGDMYSNKPKKEKTMTVSELIKTLQSVEDSDTAVVMASDAEGNSYQHLKDIDLNYYAIREGEENRYTFDIGLREFTRFHKDEGFDEDDVAEGGSPCIVLRP